MCSTFLRANHSSQFSSLLMRINFLCRAEIASETWSGISLSNVWGDLTDFPSGGREILRLLGELGGPKNKSSGQAGSDPPTSILISTPDFRATEVATISRSEMQNLPRGSPVRGETSVEDFDKELVAVRGVSPGGSLGSSCRDPILTSRAFSIVHSPTIRDTS